MKSKERLSIESSLPAHSNGDPSPAARSGASVATEEATAANGEQSTRKWFWRLPWRRILALMLLPLLIMAMTLGIGYLKWQQDSARAARSAAGASVQAATDGSIAMLSYHADSVAKDLDAARGLLTGGFRDDYTKLINDVVIPGAQQQKISSTAKVVGAASISATANHAVVLVFINQTTSIGAEPATNTASVVRITLQQEHNKWLISQFEPV